MGQKGQHHLLSLALHLAVDHNGAFVLLLILYLHIMSRHAHYVQLDHIYSTIRFHQNVYCFPLCLLKVLIGTHFCFISLSQQQVLEYALDRAEVRVSLSHVCVKTKDSCVLLVSWKNSFRQCFVCCAVHRWKCSTATSQKKSFIWREEEFVSEALWAVHRRVWERARVKGLYYVTLIFLPYFAGVNYCYNQCCINIYFSYAIM